MSLRLDAVPHDADLLDRHLAQCPACRAQWSRLQAVTRLFAQPPVLLPPADFTLRVMARIEARSAYAYSPGRTIIGWLIVLLSVAVFGALLLGPTLLEVWAGLSTGAWAATLASLRETLLHLVEFSQALLATLGTVATRLVTAIPLPLLVGYALLTLTLVAAWVIVVGSLQLRHSEQAI